MKSFVNDLYNCDYTVQKIENNEKESGDDEGINVELTGEQNATNENNKNVTKQTTVIVYVSIFISNST